MKYLQQNNYSEETTEKPRPVRQFSMMIFLALLLSCFLLDDYSDHTYKCWKYLWYSAIAKVSRYLFPGFLIMIFIDFHVTPFCSHKHLVFQITMMIVFDNFGYIWVTVSLKLMFAKQVLTSFFIVFLLSTVRRT